ncbi:MAG: alpha/beta fold hydrolase [Gemmatimonadota bacterium]
MIVRDFTLSQPHGLLRGTFRIPEGPPPRTAVVLVHGFKGYKDWAFFPWLAEKLAADRHSVVSFNLTGSGIGDEPHRFSELDAFAANTYTREQQDLARVLTAVRDDLLPRPPDRVGLLGHSRGGAGAILQAGHGTEVDALVTWSAVADLDRWDAAVRDEWRETGRIFVLNSRTGQQMPLDVTLLEDLEAHPRELDVAAAAGRVRAPWLIVHGNRDETVEVGEAKVLARAGRGSRLLVVDGAGHTFGARHPFPGPTPELEVAAAATRHHFRRHLRPD